MVKTKEWSVYNAVKKLKSKNSFKINTEAINEFDCLRHYGKNKQQEPATPQQENRNIDVWLRSRYSDEQLIAFAASKKTKRAEKEHLTEYQWNQLCLLTVKYKKIAKGRRRAEKVRKRKERRQLRTERIRGKKGLVKQKRRSKYETYINSEKWTARKNLYWQTHPRACGACGTHEFIHLHHMHYGNYGDEKDEHLIPLCSKHHKQFHEENGVQKNMIEKTTAFIKKVKSSIETI